MDERTLILLRHAKSDWSGDEPDVDRPLAKRGRRQAPEAGRWLAANIDRIDLAVVSPASRARSTWDLVAAELPVPPPTRIDDRVYAASDAELLAVVRGPADDLADRRPGRPQPRARGARLVPHRRPGTDADLGPGRDRRAGTLGRRGPSSSRAPGLRAATRTTTGGVMADYPRLLHTALDTTDVRSLAEFYRQLLGLRYRPGTSRLPTASRTTPTGWCSWTRTAPASSPSSRSSGWSRRPGPRTTSRCRCTSTSRSRPARTWSGSVTGPGAGARILLDRTDDPDEPLYVLADPSGHPFCVFVA